MGTIIVGIVVFAGIALALKQTIKDKKAGGCSGCSGCGNSSSCSKH